MVMPSFFSVVMICRNEANTIERTLSNLVGISDDIVVYDTGSTDGTQQMVRRFPVRLVEGEWMGFGQTKNRAQELAKYDWILSLDADEYPDDPLKKQLLSLAPPSSTTVYSFSFLNFIGDRPIHFGEWGWDSHVRLFNRLHVKWNEAPVHEQLIFPPGFQLKKLAGKIQHRTVANWSTHRAKMDRYATMNARKYYEQGKASPMWKRFFSPAFTFLHYYILRLGFLDGFAGFQCAWMTALYTHWKYIRLQELYRS